MEIKKNQEHIVDIIDNGYEGEGIAKIDNFTIFIEGALKEEKCKILIVKVNKNFAYGKLLEVISKSNNRNKVNCSTYKRCGGCELRHIEYNYTLEMKQAIVQNLVDKTQINVQVQPTIGMKEPYYYRNKLQYPVGKNNSGKAIMGVFSKRTHEIIPTEKCFIQNKEAQRIANELIKIINEEKISTYDEKKQKGQVRHIVIKVGVYTKEIMCIIVTNEENLKHEDVIVQKLIKKFPNIKTIIKNVNNKNTNVILGNKNVVIYGSGYIEDILGEYRFKISPMSFYQTNPIQTEILYNKTIEFANLNKNDVLCDLYCGIGTIGIFASKYVKKVYGIEIVEEAIEAAKENAKINNVENVEFMAGDVEKVFEIMLKEKQVMPTVIIVDPPRRGLDAHTVKTILNLEVPRLVYVSCNPATMARDLKMLEEKYEVKEIQPVDMFPFTTHVECVSVLKLKESIEI